MVQAEVQSATRQLLRSEMQPALDGLQANADAAHDGLQRRLAFAEAAHQEVGSSASTLLIFKQLVKPVLNCKDPIETRLKSLVNFIAGGGGVGPRVGPRAHLCGRGEGASQPAYSDAHVANRNAKV
jgi:hypothetical protein